MPNLPITRPLQNQRSNSANTNYNLQATQGNGSQRSQPSRTVQAAGAQNSMRNSTPQNRIAQNNSLIDRLPVSISSQINHWLADKARIALAPPTSQPHHGLNEKATNTCYIHTGIQLLKQCLHSRPLSVTDARDQINKLIMRKAEAVGVSPEAFCDLLNLNENARVGLLRRLNGTNEASLKDSAVLQITHNVRKLQNIFGNNPGALTPEEQAFVIDELDTIASSEIEGRNNRANLFTQPTAQHIQRHVKAQLDRKTNYRTAAEESALKVLSSFQEELLKLQYLDKVLHIIDGALLNQNLRTQLLNHIAENIELLGVATPNQQGDAGEFASKILELYNQFISTTSNESKEVIHKGYADVTHRMMQYTESPVDSTEYQEMTGSIITTIDNVLTHCRNNRTPLQLQSIINVRLEGGYHASEPTERQNIFPNPMSRASMESKGLSKLPEQINLGIERKTVDFTSNPPRYVANNEPIALNSLKSVPLSFPIYDQRSGAFSNQSANYGITAFSVHSGTDNAGHWQAYSKSRNGTWHCMNDNIVTAVSEQHALNKARVASTFVLKRW